MNSRRKILRLAVLVLLGAALFFASIATTSLWDNDESTYAEIAKEMVLTGHWLTPQFNNESWFCHPPLYMWLTAAVFKAFGWSELSARFFPSLFAILGMLMLFAFAASWWDDKKGFLAAAVLGTSLQYLIQGGMATMDTILNTFLLAAFYSAWRALDERKRGWWTAFFISCALATLAKGVFGLVYPLFIFALYLAAARQTGRWREVPWASGLAVYLLISAPWFVYETWRHGNVFLHQVFYFYTFKRVVSPILHQSGPWYYYFPVLLLGFLPWSGFLPWIVWKTWRSRGNRKIAFLGVWAAATFVFFTLVSTKLPNYIFFLYPPLALLLAYFWETFDKKQILYGTSFSLVLVGGLTGAAKIFALQKLLPRELDGNLQKLWPILGILFAGILLAAAAKLLLRANRFAFASLAAAMSVFWLVLHFQFSRIVETYKPMKPLAETLKIYRGKFPAAVLAYHVPGTASLVFYADSPILNVNDPGSFLKLWKTRKLYCFLEDKTLESLKPQMRAYWPLEHERTVWLVANFKVGADPK